MTNMKIAIEVATLLLAARKPVFDLNFNDDGTNATPGSADVIDAAYAEGCAGFQAANNCSIDGPIIVCGTAALTLFAVGHPDTPLAGITVESTDPTVQHRRA